MIPLGDCRDEDVIEEIFGTTSELARLVELHGDEFTMGSLTVTYRDEDDIHEFWST